MRSRMPQVRKIRGVTCSELQWIKIALKTNEPHWSQLGLRSLGVDFFKAV